MALLPLPEPPAPAGGYAPVIIRHRVGFVSGQFPIRDGVLVFKGRIGAELTPDQGRLACEIAALNVLAQIGAATGGFAALDGLLRLDGHVASADGFTAQPAILDVASRIFTDRLGERGTHARTAFAPSRLPLDAAVELCVTFAVR
ncbi:RidA family protein [Algihabitans sp.]|uniref:RidA family protein n=1 Tax=Algihabitans sp. TaxID=2821514 RepID=UPI003BA96376